MIKFIISLLLILNSILYAEFIRDNTRKIVIDTATNLIWEDDGAVTIEYTSGGTASYDNWSDAISYCNNYSVSNISTTWRVPNIKELESIVDIKRSYPAIKSVFQNISSSSYWSSSTIHGSSNSAWNVFFDNGYSNYNDKNYSTYVRCVRGGQ